MPTWLKFGITLGLALIGLSFLSMMVGMTNGGLGSVLNFGLMGALVFLGIKELRANDSEASFSFGQVFKQGLFIVLVASTLMTLTGPVYYAFYGEQIKESQLAEMETELINQNLPDEDIDRALQMAGKFINRFTFTIGTFFTIFIMGLIVALIVAAIDQKIAGLKAASQASENEDPPGE